MSETMQAARAQLVAEIEAEVRATGRRLGFSSLSESVRAALLEVPRHELVPPEHRRLAYDDTPLPVGSGQTISQPYIVAVMSELLGVSAGDRVLELGTGSGYQAAVLAAMGVDVYSIEIVPTLAEHARVTLDRLGYGQVHTRVGDGWTGWPEAAPFDAILLTAAAARAPQHLVRQLAPNGRLVMPLGTPDSIQELIVMAPAPDGRLTSKSVLPVRFVPVTGAAAS